jgi:hypothetical protein
MVMVPSGFADWAHAGATPIADSPAMAARRVIVLVIKCPPQFGAVATW